jgi:hypothetical protein
MMMVFAMLLHKLSTWFRAFQVLARMESITVTLPCTSFSSSTRVMVAVYWHAARWLLVSSNLANDTLSSTPQLLLSQLYRAVGLIDELLVLFLEGNLKKMSTSLNRPRNFVHLWTYSNLSRYETAEQRNMNWIERRASVVFRRVWFCCFASLVRSQPSFQSSFFKDRALVFFRLFLG